MDSVEGIFAAARELRDLLVKEIRAKREAARIRRNELARMRYAANKSKPKEVISKPDYHADVYEGCTCFLGHPPCSYCTDHDPEDED